MVGEDLDASIERHIGRREPTGAECFGPEDIAVIKGEIPPPRPFERKEPGVISSIGEDPDQEGES